ncbi:MAG: uracil phosphoribosyltransferase [Gammaproteobacteria bacterium]|nr:uracil phosphoribosyltransferase [Gammaproteobacteria bacterium]
MTLRQHKKFKNFYTVTHPLLQHKLSTLRDVKTVTKEFKELVSELTMLLAYEATKDLPMTKARVTTPLETFDAPVLAGRKPVIVPILRAGLGMVEGLLALMPGARVGHIGLFRDEDTLEPQSYYFKIPPNSQERQFYVCDPMLATGGSAVAAVDQLKSEGIRKIAFLCIIAAPEGMEKFCTAHPDVQVYCAGLDRKLNEHGYILPGLGDAGDRIFGTK